jgi:hypothetical protein
MGREIESRFLRITKKWSKASLPHSSFGHRCCVDNHVTVEIVFPLLFPPTFSLLPYMSFPGFTASGSGTTLRSIISSPVHLNLSLNPNFASSTYRYIIFGFESI